MINNTSKNNGENIGNERSGVATAKANTTGRSLTGAGKYYNVTNSPTNFCRVSLARHWASRIRRASVVSRLFHFSEMLRVEAIANRDRFSDKMHGRWMKGCECSCNVSFVYISGGKSYPSKRHESIELGFRASYNCPNFFRKICLRSFALWFARSNISFKEAIVKPAQRIVGRIQRHNTCVRRIPYIVRFTWLPHQR